METALWKCARTISTTATIPGAPSSRLPTSHAPASRSKYRLLASLAIAARTRIPARPKGLRERNRRLAPQTGHTLAGARVERFIHLRFHAFLGQGGLGFLPQERILEPVREGGAALGNVDRALVGVLLAGHARFVLAVIVGTVPADQPQRFLADPEMGVEPVAAVGRSGNETYGLVVLAIDLIGLAVLPRGHPDRAWPSVGIALALDAHEHGRRHVGVGLGITAGDVLPDKSVEHVGRHVRLHPLVAGRAPVIEVELGIEDVGDEIGLAHGEPAQRV